MTVRELVESMKVNGVKKIYDDKKKMYVKPNVTGVLNREVKDVTYHKGYGFKQTNVVLHI